MTNPSQGITGTCSVPMLAQENDWIKNSFVNIFTMHDVSKSEEKVSI